LTTRHTDERAGERRSRRGRRLTDRQAEILDLISEGLENKEIGRRLGLTEQAVKEHVSALLRRLSVRNRAGLADAAAMLRIVGSTEIASEWLHLLFLHAPLLIVLLEGPEHRLIAANDAYRRAVGGTFVVGQTAREVMQGEENVPLIELLDEAYATRSPRLAREVGANYYREGATDATPGYHNIYIEPMLHADGTPGGLVLFGVDVTDVVEARRSAREIEDERSIAFDQLPSGVITIRGDGTISNMNTVGREILGLPREPVGQSAWETLLFADAAGRALAPERRPLRRALSGERVPATEYSCKTTTTGRPIRLRISAAPLFDAKGKVRGAVGVFTPSLS